MQRFNRWLALKITASVSTMWCAYTFALIALISLPAALRTHSLIVIIAWIAQTFLQLVLLSVIMVGQQLQGEQHVRLHQSLRADILKVHNHLGIKKEPTSMDSIKQHVEAALETLKSEVESHVGLKVVEDKLTEVVSLLEQIAADEAPTPSEPEAPVASEPVDEPVTEAQTEPSEPVEPAQDPTTVTPPENGVPVTDADGQPVTDPDAAR